MQHLDCTCNQGRCACACGKGLCQKNSDGSDPNTEDDLSPFAVQALALATAQHYRPEPAADHETVRLAALDLRELAQHQFKQREQLLAPWLGTSARRWGGWHDE